MEPEAVETPREKRKPASRIMAPEMRALRKFAQALELMEPNAQKAAIGWLADRYLHIKLWDWL